MSDTIKVALLFVVAFLILIGISVAVVMRLIPVIRRLEGRGPDDLGN